MQTLVIFDIGNTKLRNRVGRHCRDLGLARIQYSAYQGEMDEERRARLQSRVEESVAVYNEEETEEDRYRALVVHIFPFCAADFGKARVIQRHDVAPAPLERLPALLFA
jgi:CRISPR-associated endonuclease Cas2